MKIERILAIIDHSSHAVYLDYLDKETLDRYNGSEQDYINENYDFDGDYSWDYVVDVELITPDKEPTDVTTLILNC